MNTKNCATCGIDKPVVDYTKRSSAPDGLDKNCRDCQRAMREARVASGGSRTRAPRASSIPVLNPTAAPLPTTTAAEDYKPSAELIGTWAAAQLLTRRGRPASTFLFIGPSGAGKTEAARHLAKISGLPFAQVDAPSIVDPESWFGTREVVAVDGVPTTRVTDSAFVQAVQSRGVLLIDEVNRISDAVRNNLLALFDDSRAVTNPLTGQPLVRHPECFIIMTGNVGLAFTGTYAIDPALFTRALTTRFDYLDQTSEQALAVSRTGCTPDHAYLFVRFAAESRERAKRDEDFQPISTREVLKACELVSVGLDPDTAAHETIINAAPSEGGGESAKAKLEMIWTGVRKPAAK